MTTARNNREKVIAINASIDFRCSYDSLHVYCPFLSSRNSISCLSLMGTSKSIYEKPGTLNYYRFSAEEYALVKEVWSGIEINPQFYGNACLSR